MKISRIAITIVIFFVVLAGAYFMLQNAKPSMNGSTSNSMPLVAPTPIPFEEMTIPYLKNKKYEGKMGPQEPYAQMGKYSSFLTSYTSDGLNINGLLTIPSGTMPVGGWPAIVFVHGYIPPTQYATTEKYIAYVDGLARSGFVVFKIDLRGHGESEGVAAGGYYSSDYVVDVLNAKTALGSTDFVNKDNIGFWGHSMAGNVTLRALAASPSTKAIVIWGGAVFTYEDWAKYGLNDNSYRPAPQVTQRVNLRNAIFSRHGQFDKNNAFWKLVTPINFLEAGGGAIALHHSVDDSVVNVNYSRDLAKILDDKKIDHEYFEYSSGGHNIESPSFELAMSRTVEFYNKYLKGGKK